jgi:hypothetical protein
MECLEEKSADRFNTGDKSGYFKALLIISMPIS